jgi:ABC-type dipeptide/oligopeptide/nickel transport system permease subunit
MSVTLLPAYVSRADAPTCYSRTVNDWLCADYLRDRSSEIAEATGQHLAITLVAVLAGLLIAFPIALLARRFPRFEAAILGVTTGLYTIPSLALFPLLVPFTGLTPTTVVIGLALYALTILVRLDARRASKRAIRCRGGRPRVGLFARTTVDQDRAPAGDPGHDGRSAGSRPSRRWR